MIFDFDTKDIFRSLASESYNFCGMIYQSSSEESYEPGRAVGGLMNDI
jgi:hypothetical protein